jgi:two-component system, chemotaxis family, CheB/CheR fusion protein
MSLKNSETDEIRNIPVVGIGYSAGGLEALKLILGQLGRNTGMTYVIVQHQKPNEKSDLSEILSKITEMTIHNVKNNTRLDTNAIYILPTTFDITIEKNSLNLRKRTTENSPQFNIDVFFNSLAQERKTKAIGVVLSGVGSDGTIGLKSIRSEGGVTLVQDPKTARFDGMPRSAIASAVADYVLPPEAIAVEIKRISKHPYINLKSIEDLATDTSALSHEKSVMGQILKLLYQETKIDFSQYKITTIRRRIERQMMLSKIESPEKYLELLEKNVDKVRALYGDIFIHVTDFFRDPDSFEALKEKVFEPLIKNRTKDTPIRIWVPGCATGEEVYSLAILFVEALEEQSLKIPLNIFAGDISEHAIQKARKGMYADYQMRNISEARRERFFEKVSTGYKVKKSIRDLCIFSRHDVTSNPPIPKVNLISCRNVLIYFSTELQKKIFPVFHYALNSPGFLWLGRAENPSSDSKLFSTVDKGHKLFAKTKGAQTTPPHFSTGSYSGITNRPDSKKISVGLTSEDSTRNIDQVLLYRYSPASVVVNSAFEILQFRGRTVPYLEPSPGSANYSLLKMAHPEIVAALRMCIQNAKKSEVQTRKENVPFVFENKKRRVNIDVMPLNPMASAKDRQYLVIFEDSTETKSKVKSKPSSSKKSFKKDEENQVEALTQYVSQLQQELEDTKEYQQSLVEEYESAQEELTSTNEELRSTNEELHSTNEELHSTNEELGTAKEESQAANEELLSTNEELYKRNHELETALKDLEYSERRFRLMIEGVRDYAIFMLDPEGKVTTWNEGANRLKGYEPREIIGKHFSTFYSHEERSWKPQRELDVAIATGRSEDMGWRIKKDGSKFWANVVVTAIRDGDQRLVGFIKVTRDLTERKRAEDEVKRSGEELEKLARTFNTALSSSPDFHYILDTDHRFTYANKALLDLWGKTFEDVLGKNFEDLGYPADLVRMYNEQLHEVLKGKTVSGEYQYTNYQGKFGYFEYVFVSIFDESGKVQAISGTTRDVTERKLRENERLQEQKRVLNLEQIKNSEKTLDQIFNESPSFMALTTGKTHVYERSNQRYYELLGRDSSIIGQTVRSVLPEIEEQGFLKLLDEAYESGEPFKANEAPLIIHAPSGEERHLFVDFVYQPIRNAEGLVYGLLHHGYDVTEKVLTRRKSENAMAAIGLERDNFRNLFKQTPELVCILSGSNHIFEFVNEAHVRVLGFDATGMSVREAQPESVQVHGILDKVYQTGETAELHEISVNVGGKVRYFNLTYAAKRESTSKNSKIDGVMILGTEVTDQVVVREQLEQAIRARDEFLSVASHELKTPLTSLQMQAQLRERNVLKGDPQAFSFEKLRKMFEGDKKQIYRITRLIDDMLDVTRIVLRKLTLRREEANLGDIVKDVADSFHAQFAATNSVLHVNIEDNLIGLFDRFRMEQVVTNLLNNALKYGKDKPVHISLRHNDDYAILVIRDEGIGIDEKDKERIFHQFERAVGTNIASGLGLGLYIAKQLVEGHGGSIRVESTLNQGASFIVELPLLRRMT